MNVRPAPGPRFIDSPFPGPQATEAVIQTTSYAIEKVWRQPRPTLNDMTLPEDYIVLIKPCLGRLGFSVKNEAFDEYIGKDKREFNYTVVRNHRLIRYLLHIEKSFLGQVTGQNKDALREVRDLFLERAGRVRLYVFHQDIPHGYFVNFLRTWLKMGLRTQLVPLTNITDLEDFHPDQHDDYLKGMLDLEVQESATDLASNITFFEQKRLAKIIEEQPGFKDEPRNRRTLVERTGFENLFGNFSWNDLAENVAFNIVKRLLETNSLEPFLKILLVDLTDKSLPPIDEGYIKNILQYYDFTGV